MSTPRPNKLPRTIAIAGGVIVLLLIYDYFFPIFGSKEKIVTTPSGLKYVDLKVGTGPMPHPGQKVTVQYVGTLEDGSQFDSSRDRGTPFSFLLGEGLVIKGWDEGVRTMHIGGRRKLIVPPELAYGNTPPSGSIPKDATLTFDVELLSAQ